VVGKKFFFYQEFESFFKTSVTGNDNKWTVTYCEISDVTVEPCHCLTHFSPLAINRSLSILEGVSFAYYRFESTTISIANDVAEIIDVSPGDKNQWCRKDFISTIFRK
jgi:hypothetical protein